MSDQNAAAPGAQGGQGQGYVTRLRRGKLPPKFTLSPTPELKAYDTVPAEATFDTPRAEPAPAEPAPAPRAETPSPVSVPEAAPVAEAPPVVEPAPQVAAEAAPSPAATPAADGAAPAARTFNRPQREPSQRQQERPPRDGQRFQDRPARDDRPPRDDRGPRGERPPRGDGQSRRDGTPYGPANGDRPPRRDFDGPGRRRDDRTGGADAVAPGPGAFTWSPSEHKPTNQPAPKPSRGFFGWLKDLFSKPADPETELAKPNRPSHQQDRGPGRGPQDGGPEGDGARRRRRRGGRGRNRGGPPPQA